MLFEIMGSDRWWGPVIASLAYELLRFGAKHRDSLLLKWLYLPGIWLQGITTKQPDDSMIAVAPDGSIAMANERAVRMFGYPARELVGLGRHEELVDSCPTYAEIVASQSTVQDAA